MTLLLHIIAALLWILCIIMAAGFGWNSCEGGRASSNPLQTIPILLIAVIAFTLQVMA